jgi:hypothetical protein
MQPSLFYAAALVVTNPLARAIGSFSWSDRPAVSTKLFESVEDAANWVATQRPTKSQRDAEHVRMDTHRAIGQCRLL